MKRIYNPYLPLHEYIPDGEPHIFDGRVYIYGSHDVAGGNKYCLGDYVVWSAPENDLKDWRCEGVAYRKTDDPSNADGKMELWAPDVTKGPDGRYYLYYCLSFHPEIGVAVSDFPAGPFAYYGHVRLPDGRTLSEPFPFDPGVFTDDDGKTYLYFGFSPPRDDFFSFAVPSSFSFNGDNETFSKVMDVEFGKGSFVAELELDMVAVKTIPSLCVGGGTGFEGHDFFEAPSVRKVGHKYYFIYSSQQGHELCYAVSDEPTGGFRYGGIIVSNGDVGLDGRRSPVWTLGNNHGSIIEISGSWYIFYHRHTHGTEHSRQGCAEKINFSPDGSIRQVEITSCGLNGGPLKSEGVYPAAIACRLTSRDTPGLSDYNDPALRELPCVYEERDGKTPVHSIRNIRDGVIVGYKYFDFDHVSGLGLRVRGKADGSLVVALDPEGKEKIASGPVCVDGPWTDVTIPAVFPNGVHALYLIYSGVGDLELRSFSFLRDDTRRR